MTPAQSRGNVPPIVQSTRTPQGRTSKEAPPSGHKVVKAAPNQAPKKFKVKIETTKGIAYLDVYRDWSPKGADRFYYLVQSGYYTDIAFYRVIDGFIAQFGLHGNPKVSRTWKRAFFADEKIKVSNSRGFVSFASSGPNSRTTQLFINLKNNRHLDASDGVPIGRMDKDSMAVIAQLYGEYGHKGTPSPDYGRIEKEGNAYLRKAFPKLDYIRRMTVVPNQGTTNPRQERTSTKPSRASGGRAHRQGRSSSAETLSQNQRLRAQSRAARSVSLMDGPKAEQLQAPKSFRVLFETTQGSFIVNIKRDWAPKGVDRFYNLVKLGFFTDIAFFRVVSNFMAQFGVSGNPASFRGLGRCKPEGRRGQNQRPGHTHLRYGWSKYPDDATLHQLQGQRLPRSAWLFTNWLYRCEWNEGG